MATEMQAEELEVLRSIYEGDVAYIEVDQKTFQYKYGGDGENKSFLVEVKWTESYPDELPNINLDAFYNNHILPSVKTYVVAKVAEQAEAMLGMCMTFTLFEWVKENVDELMSEQIIAPTVQVTEEVEELSITRENGGGRKEKEKEKKEQLTKQQKRRAWDRAQGGGGAERARGWDWIDIVRHLSQTADRL